MKKAIALLLLAVAGCGDQTETTAPAGDWPQNKPITFVIPYGPGGGFDTAVRILAPELEARLGVPVVPQNIPGASGIRGGQTVHRAAPDGHTIGIYNMPGLTFTDAAGTSIGFDLDEVTWIANVIIDRYAIAVAKDSPITSLQELCNLGRRARLSDIGADTTASITSVIALNVVGCPFVPITGYSGSNETAIAVMRGEVDATLQPISSLNRYVQSGDLRYLVTLTRETAVEGVPSTAELGYPEISDFGLYRVIGGPPGMPEAIVTQLSDAIIDSIASERVQAWAASGDTELMPMNASETSAMLSEMSEFYEEYLPLLKAQP